jgi:hypothetical protein
MDDAVRNRGDIHEEVVLRRNRLGYDDVLWDYCGSCCHEFRVTIIISDMTAKTP